MRRDVVSARRRTGTVGLLLVVQREPPSPTHDLANVAVHSYPAIVRAVAMLRWEDALAARLTKVGWEVHDLDFGRMAAIRAFEDEAAARGTAERDLPSGVPIRLGGGGFIVGRAQENASPDELQQLVPRPTAD